MHRTGAQYPPRAPVCPARPAELSKRARVLCFLCKSIMVGKVACEMRPGGFVLSEKGEGTSVTATGFGLIGLGVTCVGWSKKLAYFSEMRCCGSYRIIGFSVYCNN